MIDITPEIRYILKEIDHSKSFNKILIENSNKSITIDELSKFIKKI